MNAFSAYVIKSAAIDYASFIFFWIGGAFVAAFLLLLLERVYVVSRRGGLAIVFAFTALCYVLCFALASYLEFDVDKLSDDDRISIVYMLSLVGFTTGATFHSVSNILGVLLFIILINIQVFRQLQSEAQSTIVRYM